jgi:hypothetical protein
MLLQGWVWEETKESLVDKPLTFFAGGVHWKRRSKKV